MNLDRLDGVPKAIPEKQGLKPTVYIVCISPYRLVPKAIPEKQGLKHRFSSIRDMEFTEVPKAIPEKQGLKPRMKVEATYGLQCPKGHSRKTRIETYHRQAAELDAGESQRPFQKNKD